MKDVGSEVTVHGERYRIEHVEPARFTGYRFILRRLEDDTTWVGVGRRVQHNTTLIPHSSR